MDAETRPDRTRQDGAAEPPEERRPVPMWLAALRILLGLPLVWIGLVLLMMTPMGANGDPWKAVPYALFFSGPLVGLGAWSTVFTQPRQRLPRFLLGGVLFTLALIVIYQDAF